MEVIVHRRQFAISREHAQLPPRWRRVAIGGGYTLCHDPALATAEIAPQLGGGLLLGNAFGHGSDASTGRYAALQFPLLSTDATGLLALYYRIDPAGVVVTSSPAVAKAFFGAEASPRALPRTGLNWHPSPASPLTGWSRLMADQTINLDTGRVEHRGLSVRSALDEDQAVSRVGELLTASAAQIAPRYERVLLPLTAGLDSRTLMAALIAANVPFETFTQVFGKNSHHDAVLAAEISRRYGIRHHVVKSQGNNERWARSLAMHQLDSVHDADVASLFAGGLYANLRQGDVMLRGGLFELGRLDYHGRLYGLSFGRNPERLAAAILRRFRERPDGPLHAAVEAWVKHRLRHDIGLELGDAFFFDQDIGGWLSAVEQGLDSLPGVSLHPANSIAALRCLMSTTSTRRRAGCIQRRMIAQIDPELDRFEYNPVRQLRQRLRGSSFETMYYRLCTMLSIHPA